MPEINLRAERLNKGLSAEAAAREMGVTAATLLNAEIRAFTPRPASAKKIADFYGYKVTDIWPLDESTEAAA